MVVSLRIPLLAEANSVVKSRNGDGGVWHSTLAIPLKLKRMTSQTLQGAPPGCDSPRMLPLASCIPSRIVLHSSTRNSPMPGTKEPTIRPWRAAGARLQSRWGERVAEFLRQPRTAAGPRPRPDASFTQSRSDLHIHGPRPRFRHLVHGDFYLDGGHATGGVRTWWPSVEPFLRVGSFIPHCNTTVHTRRTHTHVAGCELFKS